MCGSASAPPAVAGALAGLAATGQVLGTERSLTAGVAASFGFDAITVALLGRSTPWGTFFGMTARAAEVGTRRCGTKTTG